MSVAKGLCGMHRARLERHGHLENTRPEYWGSKTKHPMWNAWNHVKRFSKKGEVCESWDKDFFQFVIDVGERPSGKHRLYRADETKQYSKDNFVWKKAFTERADGEDELTYQARRSRAYRAIHKEAVQSYDIKRYYGLSKAEYAKMKTDCGNKCEICRKEEIAIDNNGSVRNLAVDHCHETDKVRGLLCTKCNMALGGVNDSIPLLYKMIDYLKRQ